MGRKSTQLQIRVTPEQKGALKRLACEAGLSVSAYVLAVVLPTKQLEFNRSALALKGATDLPAALSELQSLLSALPAEEFSDAVGAADFDDVPPRIRNLIAATVEQEAQRKRVEPPEWVHRVDPLERPYFAWTLRSLRPHLMRVTPLAFKRRNVFVVAREDIGGEVSGFASVPVRDAAERFRHFDAELAEVAVEAELCLVGGAVVVLAFNAAPETRRIGALLKSTDLVRGAAQRVAEAGGLGADWLSSAVRSFLGSAAAGHFVEAAHLRIFAARPEYVLAIRCASMVVDEGSGPEEDVRYLLRFLDISSPAAAMARIEPYLTRRQLPDDIEERLTAILSYTSPLSGPARSR